MKTEEIKNRLNLDKNWKRRSKIKFGDHVVRLFTNEEEEDHLLVSEINGDLKELNHDFTYNFENEIAKKMSLVTVFKEKVEKLKELLKENKEQFVLAGLAQLRHFNEEVTLRGSIEELEDIAEGKKVEIELYEEGDSIDIFHEIGDHLEESCFRVKYDEGIFELITD